MSQPPHTSDPSAETNGGAEVIDLASRAGGRWGTWGMGANSQPPVAKAPHTPGRVTRAEAVAGDEADGATAPVLERLREQIASVERGGESSEHLAHEPADDTDAELTGPTTHTAAVIAFPTAQSVDTDRGLTQPLGSTTQATTGAITVSADTEHQFSDAAQLLTRALARSDKSLSECWDLLRTQTELSDAERHRLLDEFCERGYIDDARLAEQLVAGTLARKGLGRTGMARELRKRGLDDVVIEDALGEYDRDDEYEHALEVALARASRLRGVEHETAKRRLYGYLARRGFSGELVGRVVNEALAGNPRTVTSPRPAGGPYFR